MTQAGPKPAYVFGTVVARYNTFAGQGYTSVYTDPQGERWEALYYDADVVLPDGDVVRCTVSRPSNRCWGPPDKVWALDIGEMIDGVHSSGEIRWRYRELPVIENCEPTP